MKFASYVPIYFRAICNNGKLSPHRYVHYSIVCVSSISSAEKNYLLYLLFLKPQCFRGSCVCSYTTGTLLFFWHSVGATVI